MTMQFEDNSYENKRKTLAVSVTISCNNKCNNRSNTNYTDRIQVQNTCKYYEFFF